MPKLNSGTERPRAPLLEPYTTNVVILYRGKNYLLVLFNRE